MPQVVDFYIENEKFYGQTFICKTKVKTYEERYH